MSKINEENTKSSINNKFSEDNLYNYEADLILNYLYDQFKVREPISLKEKIKESIELSNANKNYQKF